MYPAWTQKELMEGALALRLVAWSGLAANHLAALLRREVDAIVTPEPVDDPTGFDCHPLFREPFMVVVRRAEAARWRGVELKEILAQAPLVRHSARSHSGALVDRHLHRLGIDAPRTLEFDTSDALIAMVAIGVGWR